MLDLPLALAMLWLFHRYAKEPLWAILPQSVRQRIELGPRSLPFRDPVRMLLIAVSVLVGAATHLVWDSFTHDSFWPYRHVAFLSQTVVVPVLGAVEWYKILQHASSVFGLVAISVWAFSWYRSSGDVRSPGLANPTGSARAAFAVLALAAILAATVRTAIALQHPWLRHTPEILIAQGVITALSLLWVRIVVLGLVRSRSKARVERETLSSR